MSLITRLGHKKISLLLVAILFMTACTTTTYENGIETASSPSLVSSKKSSSKPKIVSNSYSNLNFGLLASLMGEWKVQDWQLRNDGEWQSQAGATWSFYPIQGGVSLEDEWKSNVSNTDQVPGFGTHLRVFEPISRTWQSAWLSSRSRTIEFYSGSENESEVIFVSNPNSQGRITRTVFSDIQTDRFNWRMEWSNDNGNTWLAVYKVEASRLL